MNEAVSFIEEMDKDDEWLKSHFEEIVNQYAQKVIAILDQSIIDTGDHIEEVQQRVLERHPARVPLIFEVPSHEEFTCLLWSTATP